MRKICVKGADLSGIYVSNENLSAWTEVLKQSQQLEVLILPVDLSSDLNYIWKSVKFLREIVLVPGNSDEDIILTPTDLITLLRMFPGLISINLHHCHVDCEQWDDTYLQIAGMFPDLQGFTCESSYVEEAYQPRKFR